MLALLGDFNPSIEDFEGAATRQLADLFGCDAAYFATIGPRFVESSPPYFQRILADPEHFDPGQRKAREIVARVGSAFADTDVYTAAERDRLPVFRELLRPAGISSIVLAAVQVGSRATGMLHLVRGGRPFKSGAIAEAAPLLRTIAILHQALVGMPASEGATGREAAAEALGRLTAREHQVAALAAGGHTALQISSQLGTSFHTVRRQLESVYRKCRISNRGELAALVQQAGPGAGAMDVPTLVHRSLARILGSGSLHAAVHPDAWRGLA